MLLFPIILPDTKELLSQFSWDWKPVKNKQKDLDILLKQVYSFSTFLVKILSPSAVCFTYYSVRIFYSFSTKAATSFLPCGYPSQNSIVIVIVYIYDTYLCQKIFFPSVGIQSF